VLPSASPTSFKANGSVGKDIASLIQNSEVTSYIDLYSENMIISEADSDPKSSCGSLAPEVQEDRNWRSPETSVTFHLSTPSSSSWSSTNFLSPFQETWKIGNTSGLNVNWKMDAKQLEWDKESQPQSRDKNKPSPIFSRPNFEDNGKNFCHRSQNW